MYSTVKQRVKRCKFKCTRLLIQISNGSYKKGLRNGIYGFSA